MNREELNKKISELDNIFYAMEEPLKDAERKYRQLNLVFEAVCHYKNYLEDEQRNLLKEEYIQPEQKKIDLEDLDTMSDDDMPF